MNEIDLIRANVERIKTWVVREELIKEFSEIINKHSLENDSNTPDFIIARYLVDCLISFHLVQCERIYWYNPEGKGTPNDSIN
jgi:hypothetical protein